MTEITNANDVLEQAVKWLKQAAEQGHVKAMVTLGILYDNNFFSDPTWFLFNWIYRIINFFGMS